MPRTLPIGCTCLWRIGGGCCFRRAWFAHYFADEVLLQRFFTRRQRNDLRFLRYAFLDDLVYSVKLVENHQYIALALNEFEGVRLHAIKSVTRKPASDDFVILHFCAEERTKFAYGCQA